MAARRAMRASGASGPGLVRPTGDVLKESGTLSSGNTSSGSLAKRGQDVPAQGFAAGLVVCGDPGRGVQVESVRATDPHLELTAHLRRMIGKEPILSRLPPRRFATWPSV